MKIAIISDIHDNLVNLKKCLDWCGQNGAEAVICCGDVTNGETLAFLRDNFRGPIHLVRGNMEIYGEEEPVKHEHLVYYGRTGRAVIDGKTAGICHEPDFIREVLAKGPADIIFYGHTHKPWESEQDGVRLVNPGTLGGVFQRATFAVWDTESGKLELEIFDLL